MFIDSLMFFFSSRKTRFAAICLMWLPFKINAQTCNIQLDAHYGYVLPEYSNLQYLINKPANGYSLSYIKQTKGANYWERLYGFPSFGLSAFYSGLGNDSINGKEFAVYPFMRIRIAGNDKLNLYHQFGLGFSYVSRKFDLENNYLNITTGSHLNLHFGMRFGAEVRIIPKLSITSGLSFDHFSNGNSMEPNLGLNVFAAFAGLAYSFGNQEPRIMVDLPELSKKNRPELSLRIGGKRARALVADYFRTASLSFEYIRSSFHMVHFGIGADLFYDASTKAEMEAASAGAYKPYYDFQSGIHISQSLIYNRFSFTLQEGVYIGLKYRVKNRPIYTRGMLRYRVTDQLAFSFAMKSHLHVLDFPEIGFGYRW